MTKVDNISQLAKVGATGPGGKPGKPDPRGKEARAASDTGQTGHVHMSSAARHLTKNSGPPVDTARVARIRSELARGSYQVDANSLARKISDSLSAALQRMRKP